MVFIAGHRGARDLWPENSLLGFRNLRGLGVDAVEFDIHQSVDGGLVVIHDPLLDRTTHDTGPVGVRTLKQLTTTQLREAGEERIPTLDTVLDLFSDSELELHIEIKTDAFGNPYPGIDKDCHPQSTSALRAATVAVGSSSATVRRSRATPMAATNRSSTATCPAATWATSTTTGCCSSRVATTT